MKAAVLAVLLSFPALVSAQGLTTLAPGQTGQKRTNWAKNSNSMSVGATPQTPWGPAGGTYSTVASPTPVGGGTWLKIASTGASDYIEGASVATVPSTTTATISIYAVKESGSGPVSIYHDISSNNLTAFSCSCSDGGTCTIAVASASARWIRCTVGVTPIRISMFTTRTSAYTTGLYMAVSPGDFGVATGTTLFSGFMVEAGITKPSKLCVTSATVPLLCP